ncbi:MAG: hypothetical protein DRI36_06175, partial [Caldiserica bacterium]
TDQGIHTWTGGCILKSTNTTTGWKVRAEDVNDVGIYGEKTGIKVLSPPTSTIDKPWNGYRSYELTLASGTAKPHNSNYAYVTKVEMAIKCDDTIGPSDRVGKWWQGGVGWDSTQKWLDTPYSVDAETWTRVQANGELPTWTVDSNGNAKYHFYIRSYDSLYGTETVKGPFTFICDKGKPTSGITSPDNGGNYSSITMIQGTSSDPGGSDINSIITKVEIQISYIDAGTTYYWQATPSTGWVTTEKWISVTANDGSFDFYSEGWYWDSSLVSWQNQKLHYIRSKAYDNAGNIQDPVSEISVTYDIDAPDSDISSPSDGAVLNSEPVISGTAVDTQGVSYVTVRIRKGSEYWNGSSWQTLEVWLQGATGSWGDSNVNWSFTIPGSPLSENTTYYFTSKSTDTAGNEETNLIERSIIYDTVKPTATLTQPDYQYQNWSFVNVEGTSYDLNGINKVELVIKRDPGVYWDGTSWVSDITWITAYSTTSYNIWFSSAQWESGQMNRIWIRVTDNAGNITYYNTGDSLDIDSDVGYAYEFLYDASTPTTTVDYPVNNSAYNVKIQTFTGTIEDSGAGTQSGPYSVKLKIKRASDGKWWQVNTWVSSPWDNSTVLNINDWSFDFGANLNTFYENTEETYYLYTKGRDYAGNEETFDENNPTAVFVYDIIKPTSSITYPVDGNYYTGAEPSVIKGGIHDGYSGIEFVKIRISSGSYYWTGSSWTVNETWLDCNVFTSTWSYASLSGAWSDAATYTITTYVSDKAGNIQSSTPTVSFIYDSSEPDSYVNTPVDGQMYESMNVVKATATDALSGVSEVRIAIQRQYDGKYWDMISSTWVASVVYNTTTYNAGFYELDTSVIPWENDVWYNVISKAIDNVGIEETTPYQSSFKYVKPAVQLSLEWTDGTDLEGSELIAGVEYDVRVVAYNEDGTPALAFNKEIRFTTTEDSGEAILPDNYTFTPYPGDGGVHTFDFATSTGICLKKAGSWNITV